MPTLSIKAYLYAGIVALIIGLLTWGAIHERSVEHAKDTAAATHAIAKVEKKDVAIQAKANTEIQHEILIYKQAVGLPAVGDIGVVCHAPGGDTMPVPASADVSGHGQGGPVQGDVWDPTGSLLTQSRFYGALISDLQAENATLRAEMAAAAEAHK